MILTRNIIRNIIKYKIKMKLFIILLVILLQFVFSYGLYIPKNIPKYIPKNKSYGFPIYKKVLRNMHKVIKDKRISQFIIQEFNQISYQIFQDALNKKNESQFDLRCKYQNLLNGECILNIKENSFQIPNTMGVIKHNKFEFSQNNFNFIMKYETYTNLLLKKINENFPDSNIVQINNPCCRYIISW